MKRRAPATAAGTLGDLPEGWFRHAGGPGLGARRRRRLPKDPLLGHGITDAFIGADCSPPRSTKASATAISTPRWRATTTRCGATLGPMYEASRDAAADFDKTGDELFAAVMAAQMISADECRDGRSGRADTL